MAAVSPLEKSLTVPADPIWRLRVDQYQEMIRAGILTDDDPVELLEGWLVTKMPKNPRHTLATQLTYQALSQVIPSGWFVNVQEPITTADSEPEPDVVIVRGDRRDYSQRHPQPDEIALVVEVADTTLQRDQTLKLRLYARARIPVYWIVNLSDQRLEVYHDPSDELEAAYRQHQDYALTDDVPILIDAQEVARLPVKELFS
jgi:Uma2 family endonuclease